MAKLWCIRIVRHASVQDVPVEQWPSVWGEEGRTVYVPASEVDGSHMQVLEEVRQWLDPEWIPLDRMRVDNVEGL